jgi:hypothetical protein
MLGEPIQNQEPQRPNGLTEGIKIMRADKRALISTLEGDKIKIVALLDKWIAIIDQLPETVTEIKIPQKRSNVFEPLFHREGA